MLTAHEGDYWRLLIPGKYTVTACADEQYDCVSKSVVVENHPHTVAQTVNFRLPLSGAELQARLIMSTIHGYLFTNSMSAATRRFLHIVKYLYTKGFQVKTAWNS